MNIAFFCEFYPTSKTPFGGSFFHNFAKGLDRIGHSVTVFKFNTLSLSEIKKLKKIYVIEKEIIDNIEIHTFFIPKVPKLQIINNLRLLFVAHLYFYFIHNIKHFDIIHIHFSDMFNSFIGYKISKTYGLPIISTEHSTGFLIENEFNNTVKKSKKILKSVNAITVVSSVLFDKIKYLTNKPIYLIKNGIDETIFYPEYKKVLNKRFVSIGFLLKKKNFDSLIRAFSKLIILYPDITLDIIGDGEEKPFLIHLINDLNLSKKVHLLGVYNNNQIANLLRTYDFFVLPSHVETFGVVVLEALFSGLPVLVTRSGGPERFVRDKIDGIICEPNDDSLYYGLIQLLNNNFYIDINYFKENYSIVSVAKDLENIYKKIINNRI